MSWQLSNELCDNRLHFSRRTLLGAGGGGLLMSTLASRLALAHERGETDPSRPRSVILLWMQGGPSQLETFDPHPGGITGGETRAIPTSAKGIEISELLPRTAEQMHLATLVRSVTSKEGDHERAVYNVKTGYRPDPTLTHPSIGAVLCQATHDRDQRANAIGIPRHISIVPGDFPGRGGYLGAKFDAFKIGDPAAPVPDVRRPVEEARYAARLDDLEWLEKRFAKNRLVDLESKRTLHQAATRAAVKMMSSEQLSAFDVSDEPKAELDAFGDSSFGRGCLAAARLIEVGTRCVEVTLGGWDSHVNNHALQTSACTTLDPALASLLRRLEERDLLETTLVIWGGEFGRTPGINPAGGRDHWPHGFSILMAGCGVRRGTVYGATPANPTYPRDKQALGELQDPVTISDIHATALAALGVDFALELDTPIGRPLKRCEGEPIRSILV